MGFMDLKHSAGLFKMIPLQEIKMELEQAGASIDNGSIKAALVLALVEHVYADVIEPTASA